VDRATDKYRQVSGISIAQTDSIATRAISDSIAIYISVSARTHRTHPIGDRRIRQSIYQVYRRRPYRSRIVSAQVSHLHKYQYQTARIARMHQDKYRIKHISCHIYRLYTYQNSDAKRIASYIKYQASRRASV
jgi:hypothetical protein